MLQREQLPGARSRAEPTTACHKLVLTRACRVVPRAQFDLTGKMLRHFYGESHVAPRVRTRLGGLKWVDQWRYLPAAAGAEANSTMLRWAPVYVPAGCAHRVGSCRVHVNYHGCTAIPRSSSISGWWERLLWGTRDRLELPAGPHRGRVLRLCASAPLPKRLD